jgi:hypothetical protein
MSENILTISYRLTPLAILITLVLIVPGLLLGAIAAYFYQATMGSLFEGNLINWISGGWFKTLFMSIFPQAIHGGVAGAFALWASAKMLTKANYEIVAYSVSAIVIAFAVLAVVLEISGKGINLTLLELTSQVGGLAAGLFLVWESIKEDQRCRLIAGSQVPGAPSGPSR